MIKWGIIGLGNMGQKFASAIKETSNSKIVGVASKDKNKIKNFKNKFNFTDLATYSDYNEIIKDKNINAIYIATLNNTHFDLIKKCSENNKNILCEKPFALNYDQGREVYDYISKNNIIFYEGFAYRSHPQAKIIREIVEKNELGEIINIQSSFGFKVNKIKPKVSSNGQKIEVKLGVNFRTIDEVYILKDILTDELYNFQK